MKSEAGKKTPPLLYYRDDKDIVQYMKKPVREKLQWLEEQMEFFHKAMPETTKKLRTDFAMESFRKVVVA
jgi:hypothetical protein